MSNDLVNFLRYGCDRRDIPPVVRLGIRVAANRIEELEAENADLRDKLARAADAFDAIKLYSTDGDARRKATETIAKLTRGGGEE